MANCGAKVGTPTSEMRTTVDLKIFSKMSILSQKSASTQPRASLPKFGARVLPSTISLPGFLFYSPGLLNGGLGPFEPVLRDVEAFAAAGFADQPLGGIPSFKNLEVLLAYASALREAIQQTPRMRLRLLGEASFPA